ncbi:MAG TPA: hypothetical protein VM573_05090 [Actinomycetota bacterium]|nr:hypothetical protein [Actinomycetota bacterium]
MKRFPLLAVLLALVGLPAGADAGTRLVGSLDVGASVFWTGPRIVDRSVSRNACDPSRCPEYRIELRDRGRLRVALDLVLDGVHDPENGTKDFALQVIRPDGKVAGESASGPYTYEVVVEDAVPGTWRARVVPLSVQDWKIRLRAKLEPKSERSKRSGALLPNLRAVPPFEFTFTAPLTTYGPGITAAGVTPLSCSPLDSVVDTPKRCLRFSAGPENAGRGVFAISARAGEGTPAQKPAYQLLLDSGGTRVVRELEAGQFEFHGSHTHWHFAGYLTYELLHVEGASDDEPFPHPRRVVLVPSSVGRKVGTCPVDERMADWRRFFQATQYAYVGDCFSTSRPSMGLSPGWGDFYEWQRFEQYVEFPRPVLGDPDGYYVLRVTVDSEGRIRETNERDNASYAYLRVEGDDVRIVERGYGGDPWDPRRVVEAGARARR